MTTRSEYSFSKNKLKSFLNDGSQMAADYENKHSNYNLNQNQKFSNISPIRSFSKSLMDNKIAEEKEKESKSRWKDYSSSKSTLTLHTEANENSVKDLKSEADEKECLNKKLKTANKFFTDSSTIFHNPFEFPRQQENAEAKTPATAEFKASQTLLNPNKTLGMSQIPLGWSGQKGEPITVLLGAQWGDEGKGKIIDFLIQHNKVDVTARCQGGNNAGHTVIANGKKYDFHILPSGMISERCQNVIGNGVVVNLDAFFSELEHNGIITDQPGWEKRILISNRAHLVLRVHSQVDGHQENSLETKSKIGTTNRGIGPTYSSKCFRNGIRVADLLGNFEDFTTRYKSLVAHYRKQFPSIQVDEEDELACLKKHAERIRELGIVKDTSVFLHEARISGKKVLVEGANGALLDIDFGTYPYVTSSNATVGGVCTGLGIPPTAVKDVIGVVKAYQTRVGAGPFPTEQFNEDGEKLQQIGREVGVTTGRKRRCGWIDLILLRSATVINGFTAFALTKVDVLDSFNEVKVAVGYRLDGEILNFPPAKASDWERIEVEYKTFPGWQSVTCEIRDYDALPQQCKDYIGFIESFIGVPIKFIGVGASREALIIKK